MAVKYNIIVDSCCDLPYEYVNVEGVKVIPMTYVQDGLTYFDDMWHKNSAHDFYERIRKGAQVSTQSVSLFDYQNTFEEAAKSGLPTVALFFTSGLSSSYNTALMARDAVLEKYPEAEIYVVDTLMASIAEGILVYEALRLRDRGLNAKELAEWAKEARFMVNSICMVDDLVCLSRGGRIPSSVAIAGSKLDVKPMLYMDNVGKLSVAGVARGRKKGIKQMVEKYQKTIDPKCANHYVFIAGSDCPKDVKALREQMQKIDSSLMINEAHIGPVIGSHVGAGMLAMVWWGNDIRTGETLSDRLARFVKEKSLSEQAEDFLRG